MTDVLSVVVVAGTAACIGALTQGLPYNVLFPQALTPYLSFSRAGMELAGYSLDYTSVIRILCSLIIGIVFLESGLDKILDWSGNLGYFRSVTAKGHKSPMSTFVVPGLLTITILETAAGILSIAGVLRLVLFKDKMLGLIGSITSGFVLCILMLGQRMAKDYAGAGGLIPYFLLSILSIYVYAAKVIPGL